MVNRFDQVYIERRGKSFSQTNAFNRQTTILCRSSAESSRLSDGASTKACRSWTPGSGTGRASNAIIPPLAVNGPSITIRRFPEKAYAPDDLIRMDSISRPMVDFLKVCVLPRKTSIISGGTVTSKTTVLNMLSGFIPNDERIVTVEDTAELRMQQEHVIRLESGRPTSKARAP